MSEVTHEDPLHSSCIPGIESAIQDGKPKQINIITEANVIIGIMLPPSVAALVPENGIDVTVGRRSGKIIHDLSDDTWKFCWSIDIAQEAAAAYKAKCEQLLAKIKAKFELDDDFFGDDDK